MAKKAAAPAPDEWEVRDAADTIGRARKHMKDKKLMKHVKKHVKRQANDMAGLAQMLGAMGQGGGQAPQQPQDMEQAFGP